MTAFNSFASPINAIVIGASGGIGRAIVDELCLSDDVAHIYACSRQAQAVQHPKISACTLDMLREETIIEFTKSISHPISLVIIATGLLHDVHNDLMPEKSLKDINFDAMRRVFDINTIGVAMLAKHFLPLLPRDEKSVFAALSARVGSISDNRLGGWYSYRASKAALNMILKTSAIEVARKYKQAVVMGLHPGTVDTGLSLPFQGHVPKDKLFSPAQSASYLMNVIDQVSAKDTGGIFAWDGTQVPA